MRPQAKKKGGMMFGAKRAMHAGVNNPKTRHGKMAFFSEGGSESYPNYDVDRDEVSEVTPTSKRRTAADDDFEVNLDKEKTKRRTNLSQFGAAFAASRARGEKEFKYRGDEKHKEGTYSTALKGEGRKREASRRPAPAAPAPRTSTPTASDAVARLLSPSAATVGPTQENAAAALKARHDANVARERELLRSRNTPTVANAEAKATRDAAAAVAANRRSTNPAIRVSQMDADLKNPAVINQRASDFLNRQVRPLDVPNTSRQPTDYERELALDPNIRAITGMAKGGSVNYSKMEMEHVRQMKKHGVPEKYVKEEEKEAKGMNCGGKVMKYAKGGGIESKGKTHGKMIRMASGGSVSSRADGIASRGKTKCKMR